MAASPIGCDAIFPKGKWEFVHAIEFTLGAGKRGSALGVSVIDGPIIHCVLMTLEGLVLFEARFDGELVVKKAVPPFDGKGFASGLLADIRLIFTPPPDGETEYGRLANGDAVCRHAGSGGMLTDIVLQSKGWEIDRYTSARTLTRRVRGSMPRTPDADAPWQTPSLLELTATDPKGYHLRLRLISATRDLSANRGL
jgi:hypothetical protein